MLCAVCAVNERKRNRVRAVCKLQNEVEGTGRLRVLAVHAEQFTSNALVVADCRRTVQAARGGLLHGLYKKASNNPRHNQAKSAPNMLISAGNRRSGPS